MDGLRLFTNPDSQLSIVDLGLFARLGLEADCGQLRPFAPGPIGFQKTLHLLIAAGETNPRQFPEQHHAVPAHLGSALLDEFDETIDWPWPPVIAPRLPGAESEPTLDGLAINPEFTRDPLGAFTTLRTRHNL